MDLNNRRKYLSTCFACSCISNTTSSFVFSNWSVNSRHPDALLFNDHITPKTDSFKFTIAANFLRMWAELPDSVRDNFILYSMSSFKKHLKIHFTEISYVELTFQHVSLVCGWVGGWFLWFVGLVVGGFATCWNWFFFMGIRWFEYF